VSDIGTTLQRLGRWSDAAEAFDQAIAMRRDAYNADRNDDQARVALGAVLFRRGSLWHFQLHNPHAAIPLLREASRLWSLNRDDVNPERADAEYQLAEIYEQLGNLPQAETSRRTALAIYTQAAKAAPLDPKQQLAFDAVRKRLSGAHSPPGEKFP
jgi:tetratricopeptide (TPR) repeat protein